MIKKLIYMFLAILGLAVFFTVSAGAAEDTEQKIKVYLNGNYIQFSSQEPIVVDRRTLIPLRGIFEEMGYGIEWDANTKSCTISNNIQTITIRNGYLNMQVNEQTYVLDVPAQIINSTFMIPLRAVAESTGATVTWDANTKSVYINSSSAENNVTFTVNEYIREYTDVISGLSGVSPLFRTLNSLTDKNFSNKVSVLQQQIRDARESLNSMYTKLSELTPTDEYSEFHELSMEMINTMTELCDLVERMLGSDMTYDDAAAEISALMTKAEEINKRLSDVTAALNISMYR